jgi:hypothetical protein
MMSISMFLVQKRVTSNSPERVGKLAVQTGLGLMDLKRVLAHLD